MRDVMKGERDQPHLAATHVGEAGSRVVRGDPPALHVVPELEPVVVVQEASPRGVAHPAVPALRDVGVVAREARELAAVPARRADDARRDADGARGVDVQGGKGRAGAVAVRREVEGRDDLGGALG